MLNSAAARSIMISSAKSLMLVRIYFTMPFIKNKNNIGPRIDPRGTLAKIDSQADPQAKLPRQTLCLWLSK